MIGYDLCRRALSGEPRLMVDPHHVSAGLTTRLRIGSGCISPTFKRNMFGDIEVARSVAASAGISEKPKS